MALLLLAAIPAIVAAASYKEGGISDRLLLEQLATEGKANIFVKMASDANLAAAEGIEDKTARVQFVYDALTAQAASSQTGITGYLDAQGVRYQSFWINNSLYVYDADRALVAALASRGDVAYVRGEHELPLIEPVSREPSEAGGTIEWGVAKINADDVWAAGNTGQGVVVANIDTGVRYTHQALVNQYRGNVGGFNHDYDWWDPDQDFASPTDDNGHGTHTMGTMVGGDGLGPFSNDIGVAPGAEWIAAQGCDTNFCSDFDLISSAQFVACPTEVDGSNPNCSLAPDVVNNSWGGGGGDPWYQSYVSSWLSAGIIPVFSAGNNGSGCNSMGSPGDYRNVFGIGATDINDVLASFSSKGPGVFRQLKPDMVAPGENVRSSDNNSDSAYATLSGTSMAAPHVAGTIALMLHENPGANMVDLYFALANTTEQSLGNPPGPDTCLRHYSIYPNPIYGFGRIDAAAAVGAVH
ncbi:MAG: S8 family serine peptidase [Vicinamibacterales bacterium]